MVFLKSDMFISSNLAREIVELKSTPPCSASISMKAVVDDERARVLLDAAVRGGGLAVLALELLEEEAHHVGV